MLKFKFLLSVLCLVLCGSCGGYAATDNLSHPTLPNGVTCACPGDSLTYTCTVVGGIVTQWISICSGGSSIALIHSQFGDGTPTGECDGGSIVVRGVSVVNDTGVNCYISELSFNASSDLNGTTVECNRNGDDPIDTDTVRVAGPLPPPTNIMATEISQPSFTFTWTLITNDCGSVVMYEIDADSVDCGTCTVNGGTPSATCTGWSPHGQNCSVRVRMRNGICGGLVGDFKPVPPAVDDIVVDATYSQSDGRLLSIEVSFPSVDVIQVAPTLSPPVDYSVRFGSVSQDFPESSCVESVCRHMFSSLPTDSSFQIFVVVSNGLGTGQSVKFPTTVPLTTAEIVSITITVTQTTASVSGLLRDTFIGTTALTVNYTLMSSGEMFSETSSVGGAGETLSVILTNLQVGVPYTYSVFVTHGGLMVEVTGTFISECCADDLQGSGLSNNPMCTSGDFVGGVRIDNGDTCYTGTDPNSQPSDSAQTFCDIGFELSCSGTEMRTCQSDGTWSGSSAQCVLIPVQGLSYEGTIAISVIITFILTLVLCIIIGVVSVLLYNKCRRGTGQSSSQPPTELKQVGPIYEEPEDFKPDPNTEGNVAYGHVQPLHHRQ